MLESKPVQAPPRKPTPPPVPQPRPEREQPDVIDVGVSELPPEPMMPKVDDGIKRKTEYAKPPEESKPPEPEAPPKEPLPPVRTEKQIIEALRDKCKEVGVDYMAANAEYRKIIDRKLGNFGVKHIGGFEKFIEEKLTGKD